MDIICAKCGKHFKDIEGAREHQGHCRSNNGEIIKYIPYHEGTRKPITRPLTQEELDKLVFDIKEHLGKKKLKKATNVRTTKRRQSNNNIQWLYLIIAILIFIAMIVLANR